MIDERMALIELIGSGQRALQAGFDHFFTKPVDVDALEKLLTSAAGKG